MEQPKLTLNGIPVALYDVAPEGKIIMHPKTWLEIEKLGYSVMVELTNESHS